jgi:hypothetical protein
MDSVSDECFPEHVLLRFCLELTMHLRLRHRTLLVLLTPPVRGHAPRLVHRQRRGHEQHQQAATGVDEFAPQPEDIGTVRLCRYACEVAHCRHVQQQDNGGKDG